MIDRNDMLELTRRMTVKRNCFGRIAGGYMAADGIIDGTFNTNFRKLSVTEQAEKIAIAKEIPFAPTNVNLKEYLFPEKAADPRNTNSMWKALMILRNCELKNDGLLEVLYEKIGELYKTDQEYAILFFHGNYDVIRKGTDKTSQWESEVVFPFLICAICPLYGEYEPGLPECGFLFPGYHDGGAELDRVYVFQYDEKQPHNELLDILELR